MDELICQLKDSIFELQEENVKLETDLQMFRGNFYSVNGDYKSINNQKLKLNFIKKSYETFRKILFNKMTIYKYLERIQFINIKGCDVPDSYKKIEFTNDNYVDIDESKYFEKYSINEQKKGFMGFFNKSLFTSEKKKINDSKKLQDEVSEFRKYVSSIKKIFDILNDEVLSFLNMNSGIYGNNLTKSLTNHLNNIEFSVLDFDLPENFKNNLQFLKDGYIRNLVSEISVYEGDAVNVSLFGNKAIFMNHLNIFLNQYISYHVKQFSLENDSIRFDLENKDLLFSSELNNLFYFDDLSVSFDVSLDDLQHSSRRL